MTNRIGLRYVGAAVLLAAAACSDANDAGTGPSFAPAPPPTGPACDFSAMKQSAGAYFGRPNAADALITAMKKQYGVGNPSDENTTGFDILALIATAHRTSAAVGTAADGSDLTNDVIGCMTLSPAVTAEIDFTGALGPSGAYEVRGGSSDPDDNVISNDRKTVIAPPTSGFAGWVDTRVLFYSSPKATVDLTEKPVAVNGHSWNTIPERHTFNGLGTIAMCISDTDRDRIEEVEANGSTKVLALSPVTDFTTLGLACTQTTSAAPSGIFGRVLHVAKSLVMPQAAYAGKLGGGTGGLLGGLTDFGVVDVAEMNLAIGAIQDSRTRSTIPPFNITASAAEGSPLPDVIITVRIAGNFGVGLLTGKVTDTTDAAGVAQFSGLRISSPGGYVFAVTKSSTGFDPVTADTSKMFWMKQ